MTQIDHHFKAIHNAMANSKVQPPWRDKAFLEWLKIRLKEIRNESIEECLTILRKNERFMQEEITEITNLKEKI